MIYLWIVSFIWAFSFGLIKGNLTGVDSNFVSAARLLVSLLVFLPFWRPRKTTLRLSARLMLIGAVQYGLMYVAYIAAFRYLKAYEVALFTIFTPIYVTLFNDLLRKKLNAWALGCAVLAVAGTWVVVMKQPLQSDLLTGFLLVQISNLAFAVGQVEYRRALPQGSAASDRDGFAWLYLGGFGLAALFSAFSTDFSQLALTSTQVWTLLYLGAVASGLGFFLWNYGARRVNVGALAVFNDLKTPLSVVVSLLFFGEQADLPTLLLGGGVVLAALVINQWAIKRLKKRDTGASA